MLFQRPSQHYDILVVWHGHIALLQWCHSPYCWGNKAWCLESIPVLISSVYLWHLTSNKIYISFLIFPLKTGQLINAPSLTFSPFLWLILVTVTSDIVFNVFFPPSHALRQWLPLKLLYGCLSNSFKWDSIINDLRRKSLTLFID